VNRTEPEAHYVMPDLIGVSGDRAAELLRTRGFRVAIVGSTPYPGGSAGIVLRQSPQAGFQIAPGEAISIEVSRGRSASPHRSSRRTSPSSVNKSRLWNGAALTSSMLTSWMDTLSRT